MKNNINPRYNAGKRECRDISKTFYLALRMRYDLAIFYAIKVCYSHHENILEIAFLLLLNKRYIVIKL